MKNIDEMDKKKCCGCRACEQVCPKHAIKMIENEEGFFEPRIDKALCVDCGLCIKKCAQCNDIGNYRKMNQSKVFAAKNKNKEEQSQSSSGGVFSVIANYIIENNGIVYGCVFNEHMEAEHIGIENKEDLVKLRGSKYVQSNTQCTYSEVKKYLENGSYVLYSGTPCQIAGLRLFLGEEYGNLITIDLLCHGVPSEKIFKKYLKWLEQKNNSKVKEYFFRNKQKTTWGLTYKPRVLFEKGTKLLSGNTDPYIKAFLKGTILRESCYNCKYTSFERVGDITLGDFWGIENEYPKFWDSKGVSFIKLNTNKSLELFDKIKSQIEYIEVNYEAVLKYANPMKESTKRMDSRDLLSKKLELGSIEDALGIKITSKDYLKSIIPDIIKRKKIELKINKKK